MQQSIEIIYAKNNEYRRNKYKTDETYRKYYQEKAREYARTHKEEMSAYHKEWRRKKFLENYNKN